MNLELKPIGYVSNDRKEIVDDFWGGVVSSIKIDVEAYGVDCLEGLDTFSHIEVIFYMNKIDPSKIYTGSRHPRNNPDFPLIGIFAQRVKNRPNLLGLSRCKILSVNGDTILVQGLDAIDQTPIIDIKPYMEQFAPIGLVRQPAWADDVMRDYYK